MREPPVKYTDVCGARMHTFLTSEVKAKSWFLVRIAKMNEHLINLYNSTGLNRVEDSINIAAGENSELLLADLLVISRVLFAVVMVGFIGHFFDRIKQAIFVNSEVNAKDFKRR